MANRVEMADAWVECFASYSKKDIRVMTGKVYLPFLRQLLSRKRTREQTVSLYCVVDDGRIAEYSFPAERIHVGRLTDGARERIRQANLRAEYDCLLGDVFRAKRKVDLESEEHNNRLVSLQEDVRRYNERLRKFLMEHPDMKMDTEETTETEENNE